MAKRRRKTQAVYHNNGTDNWTNDDKEQLSLLPGSAGYDARKAQLAEHNPMSEQNIDDVMEDQFEITKESDYDSKQLTEEFHDAFIDGQKSASAMQYRSMVHRQDAVKQTAKIASDGLGHTVTEKEIENANKGITVTPDDVPKALRNYEKELNEREVPKVDVNGDGKIDEDDVYMTPGMSRMRRYM